MKKPKPTARPFEIPATVATQVNVAVTDHGWRLTFGEPIDDTDINYHTAVFLPTQTAHQLTDLMLASFKKQQDVNQK